MDKMVVKYHDFENAKQEIKEFSEQTVTDIDLRRVDSSKSAGEAITDWLWGRGIGTDHIVKGAELNSVTSQVQECLQSVNATQIKLIKEFGQVYSALEALDKDYIQAILISIKATEKTSEGIQETQGQIGKIVENQRKTLEELKKFKQKLDGYAHLGDIDKMWNDCQKWHSEMGTLSNSIKHAEKVSGETARKADAVKSALTAAEKKTENLSKQAGELAQRLETVVNFTTTLEQLTHLKDVDEMWESLYSAHDTISQLRDELISVQKAMEQDQADIKTLLAFMKKASELEHLMDVDEIWNRTEKQQQDIQMLQQTSGLYTEQFEKLNQADLDKQKQITANKDNIESLKEYKEKMGALIHLEEVDQLWTDVEACTTRIDEREKKEEDLEASIQKNSEAADKKTDEAVAALTKRVQYAYWIAAGSAGLAVVELILLLTRMI